MKFRVYGFNGVGIADKVRMQTALHKTLELRADGNFRAIIWGSEDPLVIADQTVVEGLGYKVVEVLPDNAPLSSGQPGVKFNQVFPD